ncbi:conserved hypothetical protein [delta proteobacterium NaphS2]|nr:conserved hypothetical protein [delta proteobacterium NaphS2]EFK08926.1 conserved hypothetical protein [delta proteobacterium NaphS2]
MSDLLKKVRPEVAASGLFFWEKQKQTVFPGQYKAYPS